MGGRAILERLQHVAKLLLGILQVEPDQFKDLLLDLALVDPDAATANLIVIADEVVLLSPCLLYTSDAADDN